MAQTNFLIGRGELLTYDISPTSTGGSGKEAYTLGEAQATLIPQINDALESFEQLPSSACPGEIVVARVAMNPSFIAKSYFPTTFLRTSGLRSVGSRSIEIKPRKWAKKEAPRLSTTTELFVAGKKENFGRLPDRIEGTTQGDALAKDLVRIELVSEFRAEEKVLFSAQDSARYFEVGLHLWSDSGSEFITTSFKKYAQEENIVVHSDLSFFAGNLWFVPIQGAPKNVIKLAEFSLVRVIRPVPLLRAFRPLGRGEPLDIKCTLPDAQPLSSEPRVVIMDGGLPKDHPLDNRLLKSYKKLDSNAKDDPLGLEHGLAVTSAFLFGPLPPGGIAQRAYSPVDHIRILDDDAQTEDPLELYRTLGHIEQVLLSRQYEFVNLSLGPDLPVEDREVHAWTAVIDDLLSDGDTLMTIAVGNNGRRDIPSGNARIEVPSDCVNAIGVGAADNVGDDWARAEYSAIGPGRRPGVIKPDLVSFGGDAGLKYFHVLYPGKTVSLVPQQGTSFASPYLLRSAVGIRSILGRDLTPLAIKSLLIHSANDSAHSRSEVGWGKVPDDIMEVITSPEGTARVVYQGELKPGKYLRAPIPLPPDVLKGNVELKATFCFASSVDPQDASTYTRAGLDITFRPNESNFKVSKATGKLKKNAETASFFDMSQYATEEERRSDWGKWETTLHSVITKRGSSLKAPVFDVHYNAREFGAAAKSAVKIKYALVVSVKAPRHPDLYADILRTYMSTLVPLQPIVSVPISI